MSPLKSHSDVKLFLIGCGTLDAAEMAAVARVQRLVITHQGPNLSRPGSREKAVADMAAIFKGELIFGEEFLTLDLG